MLRLTPKVRRIPTPLTALPCVSPACRRSRGRQPGMGRVAAGSGHCARAGAGGAGRPGGGGAGGAPALAQGAALRYGSMTTPHTPSRYTSSGKSSQPSASAGSKLPSPLSVPHCLPAYVSRLSAPDTTSLCLPRVQRLPTHAKAVRSVRAHDDPNVKAVRFWKDTLLPLPRALGSSSCSALMTPIAS